MLPEPPELPAGPGTVGITDQAELPGGAFRRILANLANAGNGG